MAYISGNPLFVNGEISNSVRFVFKTQTIEIEIAKKLNVQFMEVFPSHFQRSIIFDIYQ